ncbi:MAG: UvrD-helicase domain-containing protein [Bryobacteraceae bacterium]
MKDVDFTPDQQQAIDIGKRHLDACVVAGPGSGKTTVLVEYFGRLVEAGVDPLRILAITFTEKAAGNMRKKLAERFQHDLGMRAKMERAWVSTVHGFCTRLLKENAVFAGIDPEFTVADANESKRLQLESTSAAMDGLLGEHPAGMRALIRGLSSADFDRAMLDAYDAMRGAGVRVEQLSGFAAPAGSTLSDVAVTLSALRNEPVTNWNYSQKEELRRALDGAERIVTADGPRAALEAMGAFSCNLTKCKRGTTAYNLLKQMRDVHMEEARYSLITELYATERRMLIEILARFDRLYRERKRQAGLLDFADLEEYAVRLLEEHTDARARVRGQFDHILMDEFQDTNGQQAQLMQLVRTADRFYAVGDINQSIFGFRHAEPEQFERYRQDIADRNRHLVELNDNFRSRAEVLSAVETIVARANGIVERPLVGRRVFEKPREVCIELLNAVDLETEARWVARRIAELVAEGFEFREVAVLVRNTEVIAAFTQAFEEAGIPYVVNMGKGFYETAEVKDLTQLLRTVANPRDEVSLAAVLRSPLVAVSDEALLALKAMGDNLGASLMRLGAENAGDFEAEDYERLCGFRDRLREWRVRREYVTFDRLLAEAMDRSGYAAESGARGAANIDKFLAQARQAAGKMSLDEFVEEMALLRDSNPREQDAPPEDSSDAVNVMTVHASKGLEFPAVFLAALDKGVKTDLPVVAFSRKYGLGARWRDPGTGDEKDDLFQHALRGEWKKREDEESNRLLYVATTRAEEHLVLSFSGKPAKWAKEVVGRLELDLNLAQPRDEHRTMVAPDGEEWKLRVVVTSRAPEGARRAGAEMRAPTAAREPEFPTAAPAVERQESNATVTALAKFASCPRAYYLGNYLGFEGRLRKIEEPDGELPAGELGSQVHALLAGSAVASPDARAVRLVQVFRESALGKRLARATRVEREFDFLMALEGLVLSGQVDLWFEEAGELAIVDYKTDAVTPAEAHQRAHEYELQVRLYALAVERVAGRAPRRAWLHFLRPNTAVEVDLAPSLLESPEQMVKEFQEAHERGEFPLSEGEHCKRCPFYRDLCPAGHG